MNTYLEYNVPFLVFGQIFDFYRHFFLSFRQIGLIFSVICIWKYNKLPIYVFSYWLCVIVIVIDCSSLILLISMYYNIFQLGLERILACGRPLSEIKPYHMLACLLQHGLWNASVCKPECEMLWFYWGAVHVTKCWCTFSHFCKQFSFAGILWDMGSDSQLV